MLRKMGEAFDYPQGKKKEEEMNHKGTKAQRKREEGPSTTLRVKRK
jgi:hypothetical protein